MSDSDRFRNAMARLNREHADDPRSTVNEQGESVPHELLYAKRMSAWLERVHPEAPDYLRLAVCAQHLRRWEIPRDRYPMDRPGYHAWRTELKQRQADLAQEIVLECGYDRETAERVAALVRKEDLRHDVDTRALEDTACLVFLQYEFDAFAAKHEDERVVTILRRTWRKMSERGHQLAGEIHLTGRSRALVERALAAETR
ncbi:DUF4202 domain-containing protein [Kushneria phosphatilytica]|uniref:DUF4202 domain-containing protein n=1 Tax=Kushneria phosphatilytica TaxID=657387 RepID=A0A1S1NSE3_9GAMM|nr:DUF4202 domain-containing protein [Kushneria phosphatilytica]OHV12169.1 hypothetical protein BH688_05830 [Kushneria phosphatilytica]QEL11362.1 DUF4202 domain-containing protein [Kushneria phosphatilytica]